MVSTEIKFAIGASAIVLAGAFASQTQAGRGLRDVAEGVTGLVSAPLIGTARGFTEIIGTAREGLGLFNEFGSALGKLTELFPNGTRDTDFPPAKDMVCLPPEMFPNNECGAHVPYRHNCNDTLIGGVNSSKEACCSYEPIQACDTSSSGDSGNSQTQSDTEICRLYLGTNEVSESPRVPCVRLTNKEIDCISQEYCDSPYTRMDLNQGRIGVR